MAISPSLQIPAPSSVSSQFPTVSHSSALHSSCNNPFLLFRFLKSDQFLSFLKSLNKLNNEGDPINHPEQPPVLSQDDLEKFDQFLHEKILINLFDLSVVITVLDWIYFIHASLDGESSTRVKEVQLAGSTAIHLLLSYFRSVLNEWGCRDLAEEIWEAITARYRKTPSDHDFQMTHFCLTTKIGNLFLKHIRRFIGNQATPPLGCKKMKTWKVKKQKNDPTKFALCSIEGLDQFQQKRNIDLVLHPLIFRRSLCCGDDVKIPLEFFIISRLQKLNVIEGISFPIPVCTFSSIWEVIVCAFGQLIDAPKPEEINEKGWARILSFFTSGSRCWKNKFLQSLQIPSIEKISEIYDERHAHQPIARLALAFNACALKQESLELAPNSSTLNQANKEEIEKLWKNLKEWWSGFPHNLEPRLTALFTLCSDPTLSFPLISSILQVMSIQWLHLSSHNFLQIVPTTICKKPVLQISLNSSSENPCLLLLFLNLDQSWNTLQTYLTEHPTTASWESFCSLWQAPWTPAKRELSPLTPYSRELAPFFTFVLNPKWIPNDPIKAKLLYGVLFARYSLLQEIPCAQLALLLFPFILNLLTREEQPLFLDSLLLYLPSSFKYEGSPSPFSLLINWIDYLASQKESYLGKVILSLASKGKSIIKKDQENLLQKKVIEVLFKKHPELFFSLYEKKVFKQDLVELTIFDLCEYKLQENQPEEAWKLWKAFNIRLNSDNQEKTVPFLLNLANRLPSLAGEIYQRESLPNRGLDSLLSIKKTEEFIHNSLTHPSVKHSVSEMLSLFQRIIDLRAPSDKILTAFSATFEKLSRQDPTALIKFLLQAQKEKFLDRKSLESFYTLLFAKIETLEEEAPFLLKELLSSSLFPPLLKLPSYRRLLVNCFCKKKEQISLFKVPLFLAISSLFSLRPPLEPEWKLVLAQLALQFLLEPRKEIVLEKNLKKTLELHGGECFNAFVENGSIHDCFQLLKSCHLYSITFSIALPTWKNLAKAMEKRLIDDLPLIELENYLYLFLQMPSSSYKVPSPIPFEQIFIVHLLFFTPNEKIEKNIASLLSRLSTQTKWEKPLWAKVRKELLRLTENHLSWSGKLLSLLSSHTNIQESQKEWIDRHKKENIIAVAQMALEWAKNSSNTFQKQILEILPLLIEQHPNELQLSFKLWQTIKIKDLIPSDLELHWKKGLEIIKAITKEKISPQFFQYALEASTIFINSSQSSTERSKDEAEAKQIPDNLMEEAFSKCKEVIEFSLNYLNKSYSTLSFLIELRQKMEPFIHLDFSFFIAFDQKIIKETLQQKTELESTQKLLMNFLEDKKWLEQAPEFQSLLEQFTLICIEKNEEDLIAKAIAYCLRGWQTRSFSFSLIETFLKAKSPVFFHRFFYYFSQKLYKPFSPTLPEPSSTELEKKIFLAHTILTREYPPLLEPFSPAFRKEIKQVLDCSLLHKDLTPLLIRFLENEELQTLLKEECIDCIDQFFIRYVPLEGVFNELKDGLDSFLCHMHLLYFDPQLEEKQINRVFELLARLAIGEKEKNKILHFSAISSLILLLFNFITFKQSIKTSIASHSTPKLFDEEQEAQFLSKGVLDLPCTPISKLPNPDKAFHHYFLFIEKILTHYSLSDLLNLPLRDKIYYIQLIFELLYNALHSPKYYSQLINKILKFAFHPLIMCSPFNDDFVDLSLVQLNIIQVLSENLLFKKQSLKENDLQEISNLIVLDLYSYAMTEGEFTQSSIEMALQPLLQQLDSTKSIVEGILLMIRETVALKHPEALFKALIMLGKMSCLGDEVTSIVQLRAYPIIFSTVKEMPFKKVNDIFLIEWVQRFLYGSLEPLKLFDQYSYKIRFLEKPLPTSLPSAECAVYFFDFYKAFSELAFSTLQYPSMVLKLHTPLMSFIKEMFNYGIEKASSQAMKEKFIKWQRDLLLLVNPHT